MQSVNILEHHQWTPLEVLGLTHSFFSLNKDTIIFTWVALGIILILSVLGRWFLRYPDTVPGYIAGSVIRAFRGMIYQSLDCFVYRYFAFIAVLFIFIAVCNIIMVLPGVEEPTKDLNTTLALGIISFLYAQKEGIRAHGLMGYIKEYFQPIFIMFPLEVMGKLATVVSLSFRLFGNIFGGSIIASLWNNVASSSILWQIIGIPIPLLINLFFGLFEGFIQAFVFSILSLTYLAMAIRHEEEEIHV
ncbi:MAG TPA: FoF1 ATP synthase subunit a [Candidatus Babeliaceae bacterium]|nr:FoF1 ATP synthase subunit a [Candidatus Babeliaceae bacterium]